MKIWSLQDRKLYWRDAQLLEKIENELLKVMLEMCYLEYDDFEELEHLMLSLPTANQTAAQYNTTFLFHHLQGQLTRRKVYTTDCFKCRYIGLLTRYLGIIIAD